MLYSPIINAAWLEFLNSIATAAAAVAAATIIRNDVAVVAGESSVPVPVLVLVLVVPMWRLLTLEFHQHR